MNEGITRRTFLSETGKMAGGAAGASVGLVAWGLGQPRQASAARLANEKLVIGLVGCGYLTISSLNRALERERAAADWPAHED
ncbi:MAG TPA: hypothetical protein VMV69_29345 [Pirellulales bacterium]|nr:hypothetical protein [Pirellulales bacterium]